MTCGEEARSSHMKYSLQQQHQQYLESCKVWQELS